MQYVDTANEDQVQARAPADTLFGVCYSIGQDFGFNPFFLRIALIALAVFSIPASLATYLALGLAVGLSRLFFPPQQVENADPVVREVQPAAVVEQRERELIAA